ncbi:bleomycin resistance protein [Celeribacter sp.]|uniref:bleomycin resistance protein n=1 Tax=Celeribacter sp. TaxID=1890673 RepID=UPI003A8CEC0D
MSRAPRPALIPEFAVSDWRDSRDFYCDLLGFTIDYAREEDGFAMLALGHARLMIDQIGAGRTFDDGHLPDSYPFGRGVNLQIEVPSVHPILDRLTRRSYALMPPLEEAWYRKRTVALGQRQFVVADPDGYLLRLFEPLGERPATS